MALRTANYTLYRALQQACNHRTLQHTAFGRQEIITRSAARRRRKHSTSAADDGWESVFDQLEAHLAEDPRRSAPIDPVGAEMLNQHMEPKKTATPSKRKPAAWPQQLPDPADYGWELCNHHEENRTRIYKRFVEEGVAQIDYYYTTSKVKLLIKKSRWLPQYCDVRDPQQFINLLEDPAGILASLTEH